MSILMATTIEGVAMRGEGVKSGTMVSYVDLEDRIPQDCIHRLKTKPLSELD
jgi:hypothetical protein